jgi:hypothetical protein
VTFAPRPRKAHVDAIADHALALARLAQARPLVAVKPRHATGLRLGREEQHVEQPGYEYPDRDPD